MNYMVDYLTLPSGEKTHYACLFVIDSAGKPQLFENWGPEGMPADRFCRISEEMFRKQLTRAGLPVTLAYDEWQAPPRKNFSMNWKKEL